MGRKTLKRQLRAVLAVEGTAGTSKQSKAASRRQKKKEQKAAEAKPLPTAKAIKKEALRYYRSTSQPSELHRKLVGKVGAGLAAMQGLLLLVGRGFLKPGLGHMVRFTPSSRHVSTHRFLSQLWCFFPRRF